MARKKLNVKKGSSKKVGRNISKCARYKDRAVRLTNKRRRVAKHLKKHPNDTVARDSV